MEVSIHNTIFVARLKEDVTIFFNDRVQVLVREMLAKQNASKVNTELALWDDAAREFMVPHQMLLLVKRRATMNHQWWLGGIAEDLLHLFEQEVKEYAEKEVNRYFPTEPLSEEEFFRLRVKVQRILVNNMDTAVFGIRTMSNR